MANMLVGQPVWLYADDVFQSKHSVAALQANNTVKLDDGSRWVIRHVFGGRYGVKYGDKHYNARGELLVLTAEEAQARNFSHRIHEAGLYRRLEDLKGALEKVRGSPWVPITNRSVKDAREAIIEANRSARKLSAALEALLDPPEGLAE